MKSLKQKFFGILLVSLSAFAQSNPQSKNEKAYQILAESTWLDQYNEKFQITDFKDRWLLVTIVYSDCASICPMNVQFIKKFEKQLLAAGANQDKYQIILVSIKSKDETPKSMTKFLSQAGIDKKNWIYIKSDEALTRKLTEEVEMSFGPTYGASRHIMHSSKIALISPAGMLTDVFMTGELDQKALDLVLQRFGNK